MMEASPINTTNLIKVTVAYLGIPSSEVDSERSFSAHNRILIAKPDSLKSKTACALSFLHQNSKQVIANTLCDDEDDSADELIDLSFERSGFCHATEF
jgi:hypothetical protein